MNKAIGIILIVLGALLFMQGLSRKDSLVGEASEAGTSIANSVDGGTRTPKHIVYMIGGSVLVAAGAIVAFKRPTST